MRDLHPQRPVMQYTGFPVDHLMGGTGDQAEHGPQRGWIVLAANATPRQHICPRTPRSLPLRTTCTLSRVLQEWAHRLDRTHPVHKPSRFGYTVRRGFVGFPPQETDERRHPARKQTLSALLCSVQVLRNWTDTQHREVFISFPEVNDMRDKLFSFSRFSCPSELLTIHLNTE